MEPPVLYAISDPMAARGNAQAGNLHAALYDLASDVAIHWIPKGANVALRADVPVVAADGSISPPNEQLTRLLRAIPAIDDEERPHWRQQVLSTLKPQLSGVSRYRITKHGLGTKAKENK
jgi:hypothetical protein